MAVMTDPNRAACLAEFFRHAFGPTGQFGTITKADVRAAVNALDSFLSANEAAINSAIPQPARTVLTTPQKAILLRAVITYRYLTGV